MASNTSKREPEPGDLIEVDYVAFQHWAVYVGNGYVVHLVPPLGISGASSSSGTLIPVLATVKKEKLKDVVGSKKWKINNKMDNDVKPRSARVIVKEANDLVGTKRIYIVLTSNCEHFVNELRYGKSVSWQVVKAAMGGAIGAGAVALGGFVVGAAGVGLAVVTCVGAAVGAFAGVQGSG
ncbi:unnamed protein product [Ophioblennius macclurei]